MMNKMLNCHQLLKQVVNYQLSALKRTIWSEPLYEKYKIKKCERKKLFLFNKRNINISKKYMNQDPYTVLGVSRNASTSEIKKQFRILAKKYHPDINPSPDAKQKMANITAAYELLSDPKKKEFYDRTGMTGDDSNMHYDTGASNFGSAFSGFGDASFMFTDFAEMFTNMSSSATGNKNNASRGEDVQTEITLKFMEAIKGCEKNIRLNIKVTCNNCNGSGRKPGTNLSVCKTCNGSGIQRIERGPIIIGVPCRNCSGNGHIINNPCKHCSGTGAKFQTKNITLDIPAGIKKGMQMRIPNQGHCGYRGGKSGHLFVTINIEPHPIFKWVDDNIHVEVPLTIKQCLLGGVVSVPTLNGNMDMLIKPKTYPNSEKILKGKGPSKVDSHHNGDLIIKFGLKMPDKLTARQIELIEEFNNIELNIPYGKESDNKRDALNNKINDKTTGKEDINVKQNQTTKNSNNREDAWNEKKEYKNIPIPPIPPKQKSNNTVENQMDNLSNIPIPPPPPKSGTLNNEKKKNRIKQREEKTEDLEKQTMKKEKNQTNNTDKINETKTIIEKEKKKEQQKSQNQKEKEKEKEEEPLHQQNKMNGSLNQRKQKEIYSFKQMEQDKTNYNKNENNHEEEKEKNVKSYDEKKSIEDNSTISYAKKWLVNKFKSKG